MTGKEDLRQAFAEAVGHHQAGRLGEAERLYRGILDADPGHADSLHLMGVMARQQGRADLAVETIGRAIAIDPGAAAYQSNLGLALQDLGRPEQAEASHRRAVALEPAAAALHYNLGACLRQQGRREQAAACLHQAVALDPGFVEALVTLGTVLQELGRPDQAVEPYRRAVALRPDSVAAHVNLGAALIDLGRPEEAEECCRRAVGLRPDLAQAHANLGNALKALGRADEAVECYRRAVGLQPDAAAHWYNLGSALKDQGRLDEALHCLRRAVEIRPDFAEAHNNLGVALREQGRVAEAAACYRRAVELRPDFADAHANLGMALLAQGDLAAGWQDFEWRWLAPHLEGERRGFAQPQWRGEAAAGRTLLVHAEQGFGDTLQFCRYAPLAAALGLRVVVEAPQPLVRLLASLPGIDRVVGQGEPLPDFDLHCPMLSLPLALGTTLETIPRAEFYLQADPAEAARWGARLAARPGPRVGLAWAGCRRGHSALAAVDRRRSLAPELLAPLFDVPGLHFVSLQKGGPAMPGGFPLTDVMDEMADFADTAALVANLDLVVSVDTAVAHLAAALGRPVWLLNRYDSCWRWLTGRDDSPWYPTLRQVRQPMPGDWAAVVGTVAAALRRFAAQPKIPWQAAPPDDMMVPVEGDEDR